MKEAVSEKGLWNDASRVGIVFGLFSSACLGLKEAAALTESTFLVALAATVLWAVEFFGCILMMRHYMRAEVQKYEGMQQRDLYKFGRRVALLSGLILAAVNAFAVSMVPPETMEETLTAVASSMPGGMQAEAQEQMSSMLDRFPLYTFFGQWLYCFLYGSILSAIMSRQVIMRSIFDQAMTPPKADDNDGSIDNQDPDEQDND